MGAGNKYIDDDPGALPGGGHLGHQAQGAMQNAFTQAQDEYV